VSISVAFSSELLASASVSDNTIRLWDARTGALVRQFADITRHVTDPGQGPGALAFSADGTVLYSNSDTTALTAWDPLTGSYSGTLTQGPRMGTSAGHTVLAIAVSGDGRTRIAIASDGTVLRWHTNVNWHGSTKASVTALDFNPDGRTASAGDADGAVTTWDIRTGKEVPGQKRFDTAVLGLRYTRDGVRISGTVDSTFTLARTQAGVTRPRTIRLAGREFRGAIAVSPDGKLFAAATQTPLKVDAPNDYRIGVWDVATLEQRGDLEIDDQSPTDLAFSPDGKSLVALTNNEGNSVVGSDTDGANTATMLTWRLPDLTEEKRIPLDTNALQTLVFTPDGKSIITAGIGGVIQVRDVETGKLRGEEFGRHTSTVRELAISPDGRTLASVTVDDSVVRLWDVPSRKLIAVLTGHVSPLNEITFSRDGKLLASGGTDTDVGIWQLDPAQAVQRLCVNLADAGEKSLDSIGC
jgi:WD40 repeat protein